LREELMLNSYGKFLMTTEMFSKNFSRHFLKCLALEIEEVAYSQGETIFSDRGKGPDLFSGFYYVANGSILIYPTLSGKDP
jgi:CRP-like cAMP-binding protein